MKNEIFCKTCQTPNPFYQLNCKGCGAYLRERVYNLDLWATLENIIESPTIAFRKIIYSEQKNFIFSILLLVSIKIFINTIFFYLVKPENSLLSVNILRNYVIVLAAVLIILLIFSFLVKFGNHLLKNIVRTKDIIAVLSYSLVPSIFALLIIFPLELIFFGRYLFSNNPSPFIIKEITAYIMLSLEILIVLWSLFLSIMALYSLNKNVLYSVSAGIIFIIMIFGTQYLLSFFLF